MNRARRERRQGEKIARRQARKAAPVSSKPLRAHYWLGLIVAFLIGGAAVYPIAHQSKPPENSVQRISDAHTELSLGCLLEMSPKALADVDIAEMNLLCAKGLSGAEDLDIQKSLKVIDYWTDRVDLETRRNRHRFKEHPEEYENSEIYYSMGMLVTVLQQDLDVHYNPALIDVPENKIDQAFLSDPSNMFLTGLVGEKRIGTCASMPVLYAAIGRRLGYPLSLVSAKDHLFLRWQRSGDDYKNIEATSQGIVLHDDDYYKKWRGITDEDMKSGVCLRSLTSEQELAVFMQTRAAVLQFHKRLPEAVVAYAEAARLWPEDRILKTFLADTIVRIAPEEFASVTDDTTLSPKEMSDRENRRLLKEQHPEINWDVVEQNHSDPKKP